MATWIYTATDPSTLPELPATDFERLLLVCCVYLYLYYVVYDVYYVDRVTRARHATLRAFIGDGG